jgi:hypothetical protein
MRLGLTVNAGRLVTNQANNLGSGPLTINGGTWEATGNSTYTPTSITIGGDFTLEGTGNNAFAAASVGISLGNATRTITNNAGGMGMYRSLLGVISGNAGVGLTFSGMGNSFLGNGANTFNGTLTVTGSDVFFNGEGALGTGTSIVLDGGRITSGSIPTGASLLSWPSRARAGVSVRLAMAAGWHRQLRISSTASFPRCLCGSG